MTHVLVDDWLYMDIDGHSAAYGREEVERGIKSRMKLVTAAFIDCETKIVAVPQESGVEKEALINAAFSNEYLIQEERLQQNIFQVTAVKKAKVEEIYQYFKPVTVKALVPYPVGIRAFLASHSLLPQDKAVIFVDDLKTQAIITILDGLRFTAPRRISMRDAGYICSEIKRSRQSYAAHRDVPFSIVSNNREWIDAFVRQGLVLAEDVVHVTEMAPILEGLKTAKFGMNFVLPEELVRNKRRSLSRQYLKKGMAAFVFISLILGSYIGIRMNKQQAEARAHQQEAERQKVLVRLRELHQRRFKQLFKSYAALPYERLYHDLIAGLPEGYLLKEFTISQTMQEGWAVSALLYPSDELLPYKKFRTVGMFMDAEILGAVINKRSGQRVELRIDRHSGANIDLNTLPDDPMDAIEVYYRDLYEAINSLTWLHGIKRSIEVNGLEDGAVIASAAKPSKWEGIQQINIKVSFYEVFGQDRYMRILRALEQLRHKYPLNILSLGQLGSNLSVVIELYGR